MENRSGDMKLEACDYNDDKQRLSGFKDSGRFELSVDNVGSSRLISQGHDPKSHERLELVKASTARGDHTNFWEVYKASSGSSPGPSPNTPNNSPTGPTGDRPHIQFKGSNHCTRNNRCGLCEGDCDVSTGVV